MGQEDGTAGKASRGNDHSRTIPYQVDHALEDAETGRDREEQEGEGLPPRGESPCEDQVNRVAPLRHERGFHSAPGADVHDAGFRVPGSHLVGDGQTRIDVAAGPASREHVGYGTRADVGFSGRRGPRRIML